MVKVIDKLKEATYNVLYFLLKNIYNFEHAQPTITQEEADKLYDLIDYYTNEGENSEIPKK